METAANTSETCDIDPTVLENMEKSQLIKMIMCLKKEVASVTEDFRKLVNLRLYNLERSHYMYLQYGRRDSVEITGIPTSVTDENLEDKVIEIFKEAKVQVNLKNIKKEDIQVVHRLANKKRREALYCGQNLKRTKRYGNLPIYINESFCPEFNFLNFAIRQAYKKKGIARYKVQNGINYMQKDDQSNFVEIGHVIDLENLKVPIPPRKK